MVVRLDGRVMAHEVQPRTHAARSEVRHGGSVMVTSEVQPPNAAFEMGAGSTAA